jgi:hypothetical protein
MPTFFAKEPVRSVGILQRAEKEKGDKQKRKWSMPFFAIPVAFCLIEIFSYCFLG